jgi:hypothetical protein
MLTSGERQQARGTRIGVAWYRRLSIRPAPIAAVIFWDRT